MEIDPENDPNQPSGAAAAYLVAALLIVAIVIVAVVVIRRFGL